MAVKIKKIGYIYEDVLKKVHSIILKTLNPKYKL